MNSNGFGQEILKFLKSARHIWGRCPHCSAYFRLSEAAISMSPEPPRDWLRRYERQQKALEAWESKIKDWHDIVESNETLLNDRERELRDRERNLERDARSRVRDLLQSDAAFQRTLREANKEAVKRSRATLLGKLLERIAPCFRRFNYDPRDMRAICDPVDYVLFNGLTTDRRIKEITFIEVKCGRSRMSTVQRSVRDAIEKGQVRSELWEIGDPEIAITKQLSNGGNRRALPPKP